MTTNRNNSAVSRITRKGNPVKAQIVHAGVSLRELAATACMPLSTVSETISGRYRQRDRQERIHDVFCRLAGSCISVEKFWGELLSEAQS
jgi:hypothetical protein